jgi:riboflavin synthase
MFTGLVEETGVVESVEHGEAGAMRMQVRAQTVTEGMATGDSIAVNGCCLTATDCTGGVLTFDLLGETVARTSFGQAAPGTHVNLERSLAAGDRLGGHFVSGHIDATGTVRSMLREGADWVMRIDVPPAFMRYLVYKGSVSLDGVSLTVADVDATGFHVCLIPHTLEVTNLDARKPGDKVNLEFDLLAKYVERILEARSAQ